MTAPRSNHAPREFASRLSTMIDTARKPTGRLSGTLWRPPMPAFSHQSANQLATAQRRAVMAFSRATRGQRAVAFMLYFYGCPCAREFTVQKANFEKLGLACRDVVSAFGALSRTNNI